MHGEFTNQISVRLAQDSERFAQMAKRLIVNTSDISMCSRRNEGLHELIEQFIDNIAESK